MAGGLALLALGMAVALLADRAAGIVLAAIGVGLLIPLRAGSRPGERRRAGGTRLDRSDGGDGDRRSSAHRDARPPEAPRASRPPSA